MQATQSIIVSDAHSKSFINTKIESNWYQIHFLFHKEFYKELKVNLGQTKNRMQAAVLKFRYKPRSTGKRQLGIWVRFSRSSLSSTKHLLVKYEYSHAKINNYRLIATKEQRTEKRNVRAFQASLSPKKKTEQKKEYTQNQTFILKQILNRKRKSIVQTIIYSLLDNNK